ncbi:MAG: hypothetical protein ABI359_02955 [Ginsengibacter sp.]
MKIYYPIIEENLSEGKERWRPGGARIISRVIDRSPLKDAHFLKSNLPVRDQ